MRLRPALIGAGVAIVPAALFALLARAVAMDSAAVASFDAAVRGAIDALRAPALTPIMLALTHSADALVLIGAVAVLAVVLFVRGRRAAAVFSVVVMFLGDRLTSLFKDVYQRTRPAAASALIALPSSFAFPSGHSAASACMFAVITYLTWTSDLRSAARVGITVAAGVWALGVGVSRIYLGVHHPSDVVGGWLLAGAWCALCIGLARAWGVRSAA